MKLWACLQGIQRKLNEGCHRYLLKLEIKLKGQLREVLDQIDTFWMQKVRREAIRDGDGNTRYFHTSTIIRLKLNRIKALQDTTGQRIVDSESVLNVVGGFFMGLYTEEHLNDVEHGLHLGLFPRLTTKQI